MKKITKIKNNKGSIVIAIILFGLIFIMSFGAITGLILSEHKLMNQKINSAAAFQIAEAGLNYYRWQLAHDISDQNDITEKPFYDPQGDLIGYYSITVIPAEQVSGGHIVTICHKEGTPAERTLNVSSSALSAHLAHGDYEGECGSTWESNSNVIAITATAWTVKSPNTKRILRARYGRPSLAKYAFVSNSNIWFGAGEEVVGAMHANGGIRMDGNCNSIMTSLKETYICGEEHDCEDEEKPGIWGTGEDSQLWDFPIADGIDFDAMTVNLDSIKETAIAEGEYFGDTGDYGYLLIFDDDGTFEARTVTKLQNSVYGHDGIDWTYESNSYKNTSHQGNYTIPQNGLIFVEDELWVEGTVDGRVTIVAARLPDGDYEDASIRVQNSIEYDLRDGSSSLGLIAQKDILVPLYSADNIVIDAAMIAQKGHIYRYYYPNEWYSPYAIQSSIETYGTLITNSIWTWSYVDYAGGPTTSGYQTTSSIYDPYLLYAPPPAFPSEDEYEFISWEELLINESS